MAVAVLKTIISLRVGISTITSSIRRDREMRDTPQMLHKVTKPRCMKEEI